MRISEFSSLVFSDESYKFDQSYGIMQVFTRQDPVKVCCVINESEGDQWDDDVRIDFILHSYAADSSATIVKGDTGTITFSNAPSYCVVDVNAFIEDTFDDTGKYRLTIRRVDTQTSEFKEVYCDFMMCEEDSDCIKDTLLLTYSNKRNIFDTIFRKATSKTTDYSGNSWVYKSYENLYYGFRFKGGIVERDTEYEMESEIFEDQFSYSRLLSGFKKDKFSLVAGDNWGVTNGMGRLFRNALTCSETYLDGERISLADGEIEREEIGDTYPLFRFVAKISKEHDLFAKVEGTINITLLSLNLDSQTVLSLNESDEILKLNN